MPAMLEIPSSILLAHVGCGSGGGSFLALFKVLAKLLELQLFLYHFRLHAQHLGRCCQRLCVCVCVCVRARASVQ